jgi:hypothetical protein
LRIAVAPAWGFVVADPFTATGAFSSGRKPTATK